MQISQILHTAADKHLWDGKSALFRWGSYEASCDAVTVAVANKVRDPIKRDRLHETIKTGLVNLGLNHEEQFDDLPEGPKRQEARYAWLKMAAMMAEDQGV